MNDLQKDALKAGELIYAMSQASTAPLTQPGPWGAVSGGYCAGLAMRWIGLRYAGQDYPYDRTTHMAREPEWQATRDQTVYVTELLTSGTSKTFPDPFKPAFAQYQLTLNTGMITTTRVAMSGATLLRAGAAKQACYFIVLRGRRFVMENGVRVAKPVGHAVAMQTLGAYGWRFFDANFGAFKLKDSAAFERFIDWFMQKSGYLRNDFLGLSCEVVGVDPPPFTGANFQGLMGNLTKKLDR